MLAFLNEQPSHRLPNMDTPARLQLSNLTRRRLALTKLSLRRSWPVCTSQMHGGRKLMHAQSAWVMRHGFSAAG
jgi:hypothetical protein